MISFVGQALSSLSGRVTDPSRFIPRPIRDALPPGSCDRDWRRPGQEPVDVGPRHRPANKYPCISLQPASRSSTRCSSVSIPSITTSMPSARPSVTIAWMITPPFADLSSDAHEAAIDLELVERQPLQVAQARIARAEVVEREPHAERSQLKEPCRISSGFSISTLSVISSTSRKARTRSPRARLQRRRRRRGRAPGAARD